MKAAEGAGSVDALAAMEEVAALSTKAATGKLLHDRFLAIGLFRLLELGGLTDPDALKSLVAKSGMDQEAVNRDLLTYKVRLARPGHRRAQRSSSTKTLLRGGWWS